jgi:hypothetical protein
MRVLFAVLIGSMVMIAPPTARAEDEATPHHMTKPDGSLDTEKCPICHNPDMGLARSKLETCTLCHLETTHGGTLEHVSASAAQVREAMADAPKDAVVLPLADDGRIFCGTCHLYHDPKVLGEAWLARGWIPPDTGLAAAVREGVSTRWTVLAEAADQKGQVGEFATRGTRQLRLPVEDGKLCRQCHGKLP